MVSAFHTKEITKMDEEKNKMEYKQKKKWI